MLSGTANGNHHDRINSLGKHGVSQHGSRKGRHPASRPPADMPRRARCERSRPRKFPRNTCNSATRLADPYPWDGWVQPRSPSSSQSNRASRSACPWYVLSSRLSSEPTSKCSWISRTYSFAWAWQSPSSMRRSRCPCSISRLASAMSRAVAYSSTTDCSVKLPARCPTLDQATATQPVNGFQDEHRSLWCAENC